MIKATLIAAAAVLAGTAFVAYNRIHENLIVKRFPDIDPKIVRKAYRTMMSRAVAGEYAHYEDASDETHDRIFRAIVKEQNPST